MPRFVHEDLQQDVIIELLAQQTELIENEDQTGINPTLGVIIEDCIDQKVDNRLMPPNSPAWSVIYAHRYVVPV